jgi:hypothetical protein
VLYQQFYDLSLSIQVIVTLILISNGIVATTIVFKLAIWSFPNLPKRYIHAKQKLYAEQVPHVVFVAVLAIWTALFLTLLAGLFSFIGEIAAEMLIPLAVGTDQNEATNAFEKQRQFAFLITKTGALTAVLAAVVALPFTVIRLKLTAKQNKHNENVLYNDKLHEANNDLHAQRQVSVKTKEGKYESIWEDDIIRRNGAIDRLEALAVEDPAFAPRIARILCVYLKEMTAEHPAEQMPTDIEIEDTWEWARALKVKRSDMETAAQVLGRLHEKTKVPPKDLAIDLSGVNLQAMVLNGLNFEHAELNHVNVDGAQLNDAALNGAVLYRAQLNDAELNGAQLNRAQLNEAQLNRAELDQAQLDEYTGINALRATGTALQSVFLKKVKNLKDLLAQSFGDASVTLPEDMQYLVKDKWPDTELSYEEFKAEWELFKQDPDAYIPPQLRDKK